MGNGLAQQEDDVAHANAGERTSAEVARLARVAAAEGCVLLTNDGTLPLKPNEEVAVFGRCALDWFYMGRGSGGSVHPPYASNLMDGLAHVGATYSHVLAQVYADWCTDQRNAADSGWWGHWPTHHPEMPVSTELAQAAACTARTALVVIGRCAGEDLDMPLAPGGYYLTDEEQALLATVTSTFERTVVVLNTTNVIDLSWVEALDRAPSAVMLAWAGGMEAGNAVADVLYGCVNPSGRLACTLARSYKDYPSSTTFGSKHKVDYLDDIFVGYRHFDTHAPQDVLFCFGHGLSYTTFSVEIMGVETTELAAMEQKTADYQAWDGTPGSAHIGVRVRVTNIGARAGRRTVLLWCQPPRGGIPKPVRILAAFGKTCELLPGESQVLELACSAKNLASYDKDSHAFVLDAGSYQLDCTGTATIVEVGQRVVVESCTPLCQSSDDLRERIVRNLPAPITANGSSSAKKPVLFDDVIDGRAALDDFVAGLSDKELEALTCGEGAMNSTLGTPGNAGAFGGVTPSLRKRGVPASICADGPSGGRLQRRCSLLPCATTLACTWDTDLVQRLYAATGNELRANGVDVLLAPGMNIQRDPRCGRNFEYFSEDPLVSGLMATAVVRGLQGVGVAACPKHFACNNQETRRNTSDSCVSERALREIYLRGFEICVRKARPALIMTSYNKVNGVWAHYSYDLATTVLRHDWGFGGVVITDWWMRPARSPEFPKLRNNAYRIRAGVDVLMPGSMSHVARVMERPKGISRAELQRSARRVLAFLVSKKG